jgi:hypothetical protein
MISNKYLWINYEMYFHNKLTRSHKYKYYSLKTWSNVNYFFWHLTRSRFFSEPRVATYISDDDYIL